jgi:hypothetical protein
MAKNGPVERAIRVCPFCGEPPGAGVFCERCGRNLAGVEQLPTRAEWQAGSGPGAPPATDPPPAAGVDAFLAAMRAAGDPGLVEVTEAKPGFLGRAKQARGWIVRPVVRDEEDPSTGYDPGVFLDAGGRVHRLDSATRGWGQRDAPHYVDLVGPELAPADTDEPALLAGLARVLAAHGVRVP